MSSRPSDSTAPGGEHEGEGEPGAADTVPAASRFTPVPPADTGAATVTQEVEEDVAGTEADERQLPLGHAEPPLEREEADDDGPGAGLPADLAPEDEEAAAGPEW
ncbi:hypothetical protein [Streptomyces sp. NPDC058373]|uniref:hypothetical protein n=1 Tax=unclassified Streptomyces TaxID=2593676 RepID=UPI003653E475